MSYDAQPSITEISEFNAWLAKQEKLEGDVMTEGVEAAIFSHPFFAECNGDKSAMLDRLDEVNGYLLELNRGA